MEGGRSVIITLMEDNQGAIAIAKNPVTHSRTKHIDIRFHFVREAVQSGVVELKYSLSDNNDSRLAD